VSVPATPLAKAKTMFQLLAVGAALLPLTAHVRWLYTTFLWLAVVLTVVTGAQYLVAARRNGGRGPTPSIIATP
jgi:CDP-diacylglycerol--glycerol-3-phosphate 3-phosphatidyltransferase